MRTAESLRMVEGQLRRVRLSLHKNSGVPKTSGGSMKKGTRKRLMKKLSKALLEDQHEALVSILITPPDDQFIGVTW